MVLGVPRVLAVDPVKPEPTAIAEAAAVLGRGGLVAFPTETVYGLGARGLHVDEVAKIFAAKGRPAGHPVILHVDGETMARSLASSWSASASRLVSELWPGPLTLVVPRASRVPPEVSGGLDTVGIRAPNHPVALALIRAAGEPLAALWAAEGGIYERFGYGRGAGTPMGCATNEEKRGGLCYPKCAAGYSSPTLFPYVCATSCPAGYRDDGLTCFRDAKIISANNSSCAWYDKCGLTLDKGCSTCPSGYENDGCTCRRDPHMITKTTYTRGAGVPLHTCGTGEEKSGLLCYPTCQDGFHGVGPMCMPDE